MERKAQVQDYTLIWQADSIDARNAVIAILEERSMQLEKQLTVNLTYEEGANNQLMIKLFDVGQASGYKLLSLMIKQLSKALREMASALEEKNWLVVTSPQKPLESMRLKKLFQGFQETYYVDVTHIYGPDPQMLRARFKDRAISILDYEDKVFLVDHVALKKKINLNCQACTSQHRYGCCCGSPCSYSKKNLENYKEHEEAILKEMMRIEPEYYEKVSAKRYEEGYRTVELVDQDGIVGECDGRCMLLVREDGMAKCLAHKYALEHELPIYTMSPLSCLLFPFEVIACITDKGKRIYLLTSVVEEEIASSIGRWGSYKSLGLPLCCIDEALSNEVFRSEDYQSVLEVNKGLITYEFGKRVYDGLIYSVFNQ